MCLDKVTKRNLKGERSGYKIFIKANDKLYPFCYNRSDEFKMNEWNIDHNGSRKVWGGNKNYKCGYHLLRFKNESSAVLKMIHENSSKGVLENEDNAREFFMKQYGVLKIYMVLCKVIARDVTAYGRQYEDKKCYVAKSLFIQDEILSLPIEVYPKITIDKDASNMV